MGGLLYARELLYGLGFVAMAFVALAVMLVMASQPRSVPAELPVRAMRGLVNRLRAR